MVWLKKIIGIFILLAIFGLIIGLIASFMVDPNDFRDRINNDLQSYTGLPLEVKGPIQWTLRPKAKLRLQDVILNKSDANASTPIITIKEILVDFDGFSYFSDNLVISNLELNDVAIDLDIFKTLNKKDMPQKSSTIKVLNIKDVSILSTTRNLNWQLKNSTLSASNVNSNSPNQTQFTVKGDLNHLNIDSNFNIDAVLKIDATKHTLIFDPLKIIWNGITISGNSTITQYENDLHLSGVLGLDNVQLDSILNIFDPNYTPKQEDKIIKGKLDYNYQVNAQMLELDNIQLEINNGVVTGNLKSRLAEQQQLEFYINSDNFDLKPLIILSKVFHPSILKDNLIPVDLVKDLTINGKFNGTNLYFSQNTKFDKISFNVVGQNGIIQFNPITISDQGALHDITFSIDVIKHSEPSFQITQQAKNVDLRPWMDLIFAKHIIDGKANIKASLQAIGNNFTMLKQSVVGSINMYVSDGILYNLDATSLMSFTTKATTDIFNQMSKSPNTDLVAAAMDKKREWLSSQDHNASTKFDEFELKADINEGISKKASISMSNDLIDLKATGGFNLSDETIDFTGTLINKTKSISSSKTEFLAEYMTKTPLPLRITGTIQKPIFEPNLQEYAANIIALAKNDSLNQAVNKMIAVTPPNIKTPKTASELFLDSLQSLTSQ